MHWNGCISGTCWRLIPAGNSYEACLHNMESTIELLPNLGFTIHPTKSILIPTSRITFLGFVIYSVEMTLEITVDKKKTNS